MQMAPNSSHSLLCGANESFHVTHVIIGPTEVEGHAQFCEFSLADSNSPSMKQKSKWNPRSLHWLIISFMPFMTVAISPLSKGCMVPKQTWQEWEIKHGMLFVNIVSAARFKCWWIFMTCVWSKDTIGCVSLLGHQHWCHAHFVPSWCCCLWLDILPAGHPSPCLWSLSWMGEWLSHAGLLHFHLNVAWFVIGDGVHWSDFIIFCGIKMAWPLLAGQEFHCSGFGMCDDKIIFCVVATGDMRPFRFCQFEKAHCVCQTIFIACHRCCRISSFLAAFCSSALKVTQSGRSFLSAKSSPMEHPWLSVTFVELSNFF